MGSKCSSVHRNSNHEASGQIADIEAIFHDMDQIAFSSMTPYRDVMIYFVYLFFFFVLKPIFFLTCNTFFMFRVQFHANGLCCCAYCDSCEIVMRLLEQIAITSNPRRICKLQMEKNRKFRC